MVQSGNRLHRPTAFAAILAAALAASAADCRAEGETGEDKIQTDRWMAWYHQRARDAYDLRLVGETEEELTLREEPLLKWSNPVTTGQIHGAVFVWTRAGRPAVVGQLFSYLGGNPAERVVCHTFQTLADRPVVGRVDGEEFWSPDEPGMRPEPIPGAPSPAKTRTARLAQMRALARQFVVKTVEQTGEREQRLMPQPLYRYPETEDLYADGALFAFVTGTDPETLLTIESCETSDGPVWCFGLTRSTLWPVTATYAGAEVWRVERIEQGRGEAVRKQFYLSTHGIVVRAALLGADEVDQAAVPR